MTIGLRRLILISDPISVDQQRLFIDWLRSHGMGWGHWLSGGWLLNSWPNQPGAHEIRDNFLKVAPNTQVMVFEVEITDWSGWLKHPGVENATTWFKSQWELQPAYQQPPDTALPKRQD